MNLIEELGLEKCQAIVGGAPKIGRYWEEYGIDTNKYYGYDDFDGSWYEYWNIPNAPMWQKVYSREDFSFNRVPLKALRAAIADHNRTDYVSDIRNHISPMTKVIER